MAYKKLLTSLNITVNDQSVVVVPSKYVLARKSTTLTNKHGTDYKATLYLLPTHHFHRLIKQDTTSYKTHQYSFVGTKNKRKPKTPRYTTHGFTIPFNNLTHIQQNSKGILIAVSEE